MQFGNKLFPCGVCTVHLAFFTDQYGNPVQSLLNVINKMNRNESLPMQMQAKAQISPESGGFQFQF